MIRSNLQEQRKFPRMATDCEVTYRVSGAHDHGIAVVRNISGNGMLFITPQAVDIGARMEVRVARGGLSIPVLSAVVEVVRIVSAPARGSAVNEAPDPGFEVGARILSMK